MQVLVKKSSGFPYDNGPLYLVLRNMSSEDVSHALATLVDSESVMVAIDDTIASQLVRDLQDALDHRRIGTAS